MVTEEHHPQGRGHEEEGTTEALRFVHNILHQPRGTVYKHGNTPHLRSAVLHSS